MRGSPPTPSPRANVDRTPTCLPRKPPRGKARRLPATSRPPGKRHLLRQPRLQRLQLGRVGRRQGGRQGDEHQGHRARSPLTTRSAREARAYTQPAFPTPRGSGAETQPSVSQHAQVEKAMLTQRKSRRTQKQTLPPTHVVIQSLRNRKLKVSKATLDSAATHSPQVRKLENS